MVLRNVACRSRSSTRHLSTCARASVLRAAFALGFTFVSTLAPVIAISPAVAATDAGARAAIDRGDSAWERRAEGANGQVAAAGPIAEAVAAYEDALEAEPRNLEAMWKLERALYFQGQYTGMPAPDRERIWDRGVELADRSIAILHHGDPDWHERPPEALASSVPDRTLGAAVHFWSAIHWGIWGETKGSLAAVRKGVAKRIRDHALAAIALDETFDAAGPHRVLGRLHAVAPRVPLFTGWVSHEEGLRHLERAVEIAGTDASNRLYLAEARLASEPQRREEWLRAIEAVASEPPDPARRIESLRTQAEARMALERARTRQ
jgi:hypothetical protein